MLAKMCSEVNKPNGQFYLPPIAAEIRRFVFGQKVRAVPGVGKVTEQLLTNIGISNCRQVIDEQLKVYVGFPQNVCTFLFNSALGIGTNDHSERVEDRRTISASKSFPNTNDPHLLEEHLRSFCDQVAAELKTKQAHCRTVTVFFKTETFQEMSR
jgi:DNA polymerase kappa